jgi:outer membrane protein
VKWKLSLKWMIFGLLALLQLTAAVSLAEPQAKTQFSLDDCLKLAYQNSETLKTATLKVAQAEHGLKQAQAGLKPSLTYDAYGQRSDSASADDYYGGLTLSQSFYFGGSLKAGIKQARLELADARENERQAQQQVTYDVKAAFYQLWLADQKLVVAQASYGNMEKHYRNTEKKYQEGAISQYDLLQAEVNWKKLKPVVISAQNRVKLCRLKLGVLIGVKSDHGLTIIAASLVKTVPEKTTVTIAKGLEMAYHDRPEMRQQQNSLESAKQAVIIAKADYYPTATASGSYHATGDDPEWDKVWALKLDFSGTIYNGKKTKAKVAAAEVAVKVEESNLVQLKDTIRVKLESGLQTLEESTETVAANQANIALMQNALKLTQYKLEEGLADTTDLMDAQLDLDETLNDYYSGICDYLTALAGLDLILGKDIQVKNGGF